MGSRLCCLPIFRGSTFSDQVPQRLTAWCKGAVDRE
ncbi:Uncharacterised protein [Vibrio cholerae]|nr:Uncharacterised protein [Vibrio cholerae]